MGGTQSLTPQNLTLSLVKGNIRVFQPNLLKKLGFYSLPSLKCQGIIKLVTIIEQSHPPTFINRFVLALDEMSEIEEGEI